ncbi:MAG: transglutaminase-like domain-containing protein [Candidatus Omnitrophica bacterium]|nr:transglutaminase-like domain-containing protein [Candidatus Omnitrophota bacterium]MBU1869474.1 transglutaminase-like domain-containing protein [Candidatus Omnitrophota bacterium]
MRKTILASMLLVLCFASAFAQDSGQSLFKRAGQEFTKANFDKAFDLYFDARKEFLKEGDAKGAKDALVRKLQILRILYDYPYSKEKAEAYLAKTMKQFPVKERRSWLENGKADFMIIEGENYYFANLEKNLACRDPKIMKRMKTARNNETIFFRKYNDLIFGKDSEAKLGKPYSNPVIFRVKGSARITKDRLPKDGILKVWVPLPVRTDAQDNIRVISVSPEKYLKEQPKTEGDMGNLYMEIPAEEIEKDLKIEVDFEFRHFQQGFAIDPVNIGEYDKESELYKKYTRSYKNTAINDKIREQAKAIVRDESNPYLCAKKIYDYVVNYIDYSLMPHLTLDVLGKPESLYVHKHKYGDCGAQSVYFVSMCRALGIPARTTGGWQLCPGKESPHFWAEFYLPDYGWVPVDTSIAQTARNSQNVPEEKCRILEDYFFGNQDPYRFVIQKDVDVMPSPEPDGPLFLNMAVQFPTVLCDTSEDDLAAILVDSWKFKFDSRLEKNK